jgi:hypothetical protein
MKKTGVDLLHDPSLNKSTAFTEAERAALGLIGLVPDATETEDLQLRLVLQPGVQVIVNPGGSPDVDTAIAAGVNAVIRF